MNSNPNKNIFIILVVIVLLLAVGGGAYYLGTQKTSMPQQVITYTPTPSPSPSPSPIEEAISETRPSGSAVAQTPSRTPVATSKNSNWKTYAGVDYSLTYPPEWKQTGPDQYLDTVQLINPNKTVSITISKGAYPYGFSGPVEMTTKPISVTVDGETISTKETATGKGAFVDFAVGEYHVLYGTDYPAVNTKASLNDYNAAKETIAEILASINFKK